MTIRTTKTPTKNTKLKNPRAGGLEYGYVPEIPKEGIEGGPIYLTYGFHVSEHVGFGYTHIWLGHKEELINLGYENQPDVTNYVLDIIQPGSSVYNEGEIIKKPKITILRNKLGICILQNRGDYTRQIDPYYTVTTAYPKEKPHGSLVTKLGLDCMAVATEANR